jgi:uncharacterized protein YraI
MRFRTAFMILLVTVMALSACNLAKDETEEPINTTPTSAASGKPIVTIISPQAGDEFVVDDTVLVSVNAADTQGVTRVQLKANDQIVKTVSSESSNGDPNMNVVLDYRPRAEGTVRLSVTAYRIQTASDPVEIEIAVRSTQSQVTATPQSDSSIPDIDPNDPTCRALINAGLNFREGPSTNYKVISILSAGSVIPIMGRLGDNTWWQLRNGTTIGWVSAQYTTVYGNCTGIPVAAPPPSPTPTGGVPTSTPTTTPTPTNTPLPTATSTPGSPDLVVVNVTGPESLTIASGETSVSGKYSVLISNTGTGATGQFANVVRVMPGATVYDLGAVGNLDPGVSITLNLDLTFDAAGSYTIQVQADSDSNVSEVSEVNNSGSMTVTVTAA